MRLVDGFLPFGSRHGAILVVLGTYLMLTLTYGLISPLGESPDEFAHISAISFIAREHRLPVTEAERIEAGRKSDWPLLYHALVGFATSWVDQHVLPIAKLHFPYHIRSLVTDKISPFELVHTEDESFPFRGIVLVWRLARSISALLGAGTLLLIYLIGLSIFPSRRGLAVAMAMIVAAIPQFRLISSAASDDNLLGLLAALFTLTLLRISARPRHLSWYVLSGLVLGLALSTKYSVGLFPLLVIAVLISAVLRDHLSLADALARGGIFAAACGLGVGWWLLYLEVYFSKINEVGLLPGLLELLAGDASTQKVAYWLTGGVIGSQPVGSHLPLWDWLIRIFQSFWLTAGPHINIVLDTPAYLALLAFTIIAVLGVLRASKHRIEIPRGTMGLLAFQIALLLPFPLIRLYLTTEPKEAGQGRHLLFPAAASFAVLLTIGISSWLPRQWRVRGTLAIIAGLFMAGHLALFSIVLPSFPKPLGVYSTPDAVQEIPNLLNASLGEGIELLGYAMDQPGTDDALSITLFWKCTSPIKENHLIALLLLDSDKQVRSGWVGHPIDGRYPTLAWRPGDVVRDKILLPLSTVPPGNYSVQIGLVTANAFPQEFDLDILATDLFTQGIEIGPIVISSSGTTAWPHSLLTNHGERISFAVWQADHLATESSVFTYRSTIRVVLEGGHTSSSVWLTAPDGTLRAPVIRYNGTALFMVLGDWKPGAYSVSIATDERTATSKPFLHVQLRERNFAVPAIAQRIDANFGGELRLLGYDLDRRCVEPCSMIKMVWYWQALRPIEHHYTFYATLLDAANLRRWGGTDHVALGYYSTLAWTPGEIVADPIEILIKPGAPRGVYILHAGVYTVGEGGQPIYLPLVIDGEYTGVNHVVIGPLKIGGPPQGVLAQAAKPQTPTQVSLGNGMITLIGYDITSEQNQAGVVLYWRCDTPPDADYTTFVHICRVDTGEVVAQMDRPPANGGYPTSLWDVGEIIRDAIAVPLPANLQAGRYQVLVGLYNPVTGQRLQVSGTKNNNEHVDAIHLGTLCLPPSQCEE